jgi:hypothetical protein
MKVKIIYLFEAFRGVEELPDDCVLEVILENFFRIFKRFRLALGGPVHSLVAGLVVVGLGAENQRLDRDQDLKQ